MTRASALSVTVGVGLAMVVIGFMREDIRLMLLGMSLWIWVIGVTIIKK